MWWSLMEATKTCECCETDEGSWKLPKHLNIVNLFRLVWKNVNHVRLTYLATQDCSSIAWSWMSGSCSVSNDQCVLNSLSSWWCGFHPCRMPGMTVTWTMGVCSMSWRLWWVHAWSVRHWVHCGCMRWQTYVHTEPSLLIHMCMCPLCKQCMRIYTRTSYAMHMAVRYSDESTPSPSRADTHDVIVPVGHC